MPPRSNHHKAKRHLLTRMQMLLKRNVGNPWACHIKVIATYLARPTKPALPSPVSVAATRQGDLRETATWKHRSRCNLHTDSYVVCSPQSPCPRKFVVKKSSRGRSNPCNGAPGVDVLHTAGTHFFTVVIMASPTTSPAELTIHKIFSTCTIFQWNARGLRSNLSDFRQLVRAYQFPFVVISESRVGPYFKMNGYYFHHSKRLGHISRLLIGIRRDIPASEIDIPPHNDNEYACAITTIGKQEYTLIGVYLEPGKPVDASRLENLISRTPSPHIICEDLNAHNEICSSSHTFVRGAKLGELLSKHSIEPPNDGSITYLRGFSTTSSIDVTFATSSVARNFHWEYGGVITTQS